MASAFWDIKRKRMRRFIRKKEITSPGLPPAQFLAYPDHVHSHLQITIYYGIKAHLKVSKENFRVPYRNFKLFKVIIGFKFVERKIMDDGRSVKREYSKWFRFEVARKIRILIIVHCFWRRQKVTREVSGKKRAAQIEFSSLIRAISLVLRV